MTPFIRKEMRAEVSVITTFSYYNSVVYYPRIMAYFGRNGILSSSGDFPGTLSSILSGEGFDEREQGESPLVILGGLRATGFHQ
jgi:hypothetical protein